MLFSSSVKRHVFSASEMLAWGISLVVHLFAFWSIIFFFSQKTTQPTSSALMVDIVEPEKPKENLPIYKFEEQKTPFFSDDIQKKPVPEKIGRTDQQKNTDPALPKPKPEQSTTAKPPTNQQNQATKLNNAIEKTPTNEPFLEPLVKSTPTNSDPASLYANPRVQEKKVFSDPLPPELQDVIHQNKTKPTKDDRLQYYLSDYQWSYQTYIEQWAKKIITWWRPPSDYISGLVPDGGSVWIKAKIDSKGQLIAFEIYKSQVSTEMERKALQALLSSFELPKLPDDYPKTIDFYWQFLYPNIYQTFDVKKK